MKFKSFILKRQWVCELQKGHNLYIEDTENWKDTNWIKNGLYEIIDTFKINCKYTKKQDIVNNAYFQLSQIHKASKAKDIEKIRKETNTFFNIFTLASWILTTYK